ncbi:DNA adenine methylase [Methylomonas paludis]|uniref:site-specific DNA-methyltransferase (adenine-specific) n=1 Tax=Methylomonas paludis TaxID=1173101 RepID=A0A975MR83_9GAMM|nr:DNA adenine methylase [Methylomonas paludis]QWF72330.1 DNA adenine methylase [Methylomonas paludis]
MSKPIIPWQGGKRRLAKHILPLLVDHECYVEPFAGGAAILFMKQQSDVEVLNDINGELINLYRIVQHHLEEFVKQFKWILISREHFDRLKHTPEHSLTDIQRAARFFYLQKMSFGGIVSGQRFGTATTSPPRLNLLRIEEDLSAAHLRLARVFIEHLAWDDCIRRYDRPHSLFYCDPPYWGTTGYGVDFEFENYELMAELAKTITGRMIISVNDIPEMRKVFAGLTVESVAIKYTVGGAARGRDTAELIVKNW